MKDFSIYESGNDARRERQEGLAFGRITRVYEQERLCEVKTYFGHGVKNDNHIPKCQWLSPDSSPDGDESGGLPRVNSHCVVAFIGGEPIILGFVNPLSPEGTAGVGEDREDLNEGDKIMKTVAGNKIILRTGGTVQIESTRNCRTIYFPDNALINELCRNFEKRVSGGTVDWVETGAGNTKYTSEHRDTVRRANIIVEERGQVGGPVLHRTEYGAGAPGGIQAVVRTVTTNKDGETVEYIRQANSTEGYRSTKRPNGSLSLSFNNHTTIDVAPSGATNVSINGGQITISLGAGGAVDIVANSAINVKTNSTCKVESSGKTEVKANLIDLDGGGPLEQALTFPSALSDFTGLPIQSFSSTVKVSI
jgi:hypothetical protein